MEIITKVDWIKRIRRAIIEAATDDRIISAIILSPDEYEEVYHTLVDPDKEPPASHFSYGFSHPEKNHPVNIVFNKGINKKYENII